MKDICALPSCGKELTHTEGRRKKKYCDAACKMKHWAERNKSYVPKRKHIKFEDWVEVLNKIDDKYFHNKKNAEDYVLMNKPVLSVNDVKSILHPATSSQEENLHEWELTELAKTKINQQLRQNSKTE